MRTFLRDATTSDSAGDSLRKLVLALVCFIFIGFLFLYVLIAHYIHCILLISIFWILLLCWLLDLLFVGWVGCYYEEEEV